MRRDKAQTESKRFDQGFTLFAMVVVICGIALLYTVVERRIKELPAAAERATFYAVLEQIRTGVNLAMLSRVASRDFDTLQALEGTNPMVFLLETPRNYRGEVNGLEQPGLMRRSWYFDSSRGELVYLTGIASENNVRVLVSGSAISMGVIRLRLTNVYSERGRRRGRRRHGSARLIDVGRLGFAACVRLRLGSGGAGFNGPVTTHR